MSDHNYKSPAEHRQALIVEFAEAFAKKYDKGQLEHGGELWRKNCSGFLLEEALDIWAYAKVEHDNKQAAIRELELSEKLATIDARVCMRRALALLRGGKKDLA